MKFMKFRLFNKVFAPRGGSDFPLLATQRGKCDAPALRQKKKTLTPLLVLVLRISILHTHS